MTIGLATTLMSNAQTNCSNANPCVEMGNDVVGKSWQLDFSDEFNGSTLDSTKWVSLRGGAGPSGFGYHTYVGNPYNNNENAFYNTANTAVGGGSLNLTLKPENNNGFPYSTGMVQSGPFYAYPVNSYVEARIKVPSCSGCWPAFWSLQSPTESVWPPEFDIFEFFGTDNWRWPNFQQHWGSPGVDNMLPGLDGHGNNPYGDLNANYTGDYHIYGMYWDGTKAVPYLDGVAYPANAATSNLPTGSMYLIMQLALGKGYSPAGQNTMSVDWIRVWRPATAPPSTPPVTPPTTPTVQYTPYP